MLSAGTVLSMARKHFIIAVLSFLNVVRARQHMAKEHFIISNVRITFFYQCVPQAPDPQ